MNRFILSITIILLVNKLFGQCEINVNFNDWQLRGDPTYATWVISSNGDTIEQTKSYSYTSFYTSNEDLINVRLTGKFYVNDPSDDDYIGLVCGYKTPNSSTGYNDFDTYIIDWKEAWQWHNGYTANEGYTLFDIHGTTTDITKYFFGHHRDTMLNVLDSLYGNGLGWRDDTIYNFSLTYTTSKIIFSIDNDTIFNYEGCFDAGNLGIYNFSQMYAKYFDLEYKHLVNFDYPLSVCQHDTTDFTFINLNCAPNFDESYISEMKWNFGDGNTVTNSSVNLSNINEQHSYANSGIYNVTLIVTDTSGCVDSITHQIYVKPIPYLTLSSNSPVCQLDTIELNSTNYPLTNYYWSGPNSFTSNNQNPFIPNSNLNDTGYYSVYAILDGCVSPKDSLFVQVKPLPFTNPVANTPICEGDTINISADYYLGANYYWTGPNAISSSDSILNVYNSNLNDTGYFYVYAILNGCVSPRDSVHMEIKQVPFVNIISNSPVCEGDSISLQTNTYNGANYYWSGPNSFTSTDSVVNFISNINDSGYYYIYAELNGCVSPLDSENVIVNIIPVLNPNVTSPVCQGDTIQFNTDNYLGANYYWSGPNSFSSNISSPIINNIQLANSGNYIVYAELNGCNSNVDTLNLLVNKTPTSVFTYSNILCYGDSTDLTYIGNADPGASFTWNYNGGINNGNYVYWTNSGPHTVELLVSQNGCFSTTSKIIYVPDSLSLNVSKNDVLCFGDSTGSIKVSPNGGTQQYSYLWSNNNTDSSITNLLTGDYYVTVNDANNCFVIKKINISEPNKIDITGTVDNINASISTNVNGGVPQYTYLWSNGNTTKDLTNLINGSYILYVTDSNGCQQAKEFEVLANLKIPLALTPNSDGYNDNWRIQGLESYTKVEIQIYNRWGSEVYNFAGSGAQYNSNPWDGKFKGKELPVASYVYIINLFNNVKPLSGTLVLIR